MYFRDDFVATHRLPRLALEKQQGCLWSQHRSHYLSTRQRPCACLPSQSLVPVYCCDGPAPIHYQHGLVFEEEEEKEESNKGGRGVNTAPASQLNAATA